MASRAEKLRRREHRKKKKGRRAFPPGEHTFIVTPPGALKMSEALWALVEPDLDRCEDNEKWEKLLTIATMGWNAALMRGAERTAFVEEMMQGFSTEIRQDLRQIIDSFIRRKDELFPHIDRPIVDFELTTRAGGALSLSRVRPESGYSFPSSAI